MINPTWFDWLGLVGIWAAAFATFYAARTALKIARKQQSIQLNPELETSYIFPAGSDPRPCIGLGVTNLGFWEATITGFQFKHWLYRGSYFVADLDWSISPALPARILNAENKTFFSGLGKGHKGYVTDLAKQIFGSRWLLIAYSLKIYVKAGNGEEYGAKPGKGFRKLLFKAAWSKLDKEEDT